MEWDMIPQGTERQSIRLAPSSSFETGRAIPSSRERFDVVVLVKTTYRWNAKLHKFELVRKRTHVRTNWVLKKEVSFAWQIPPLPKPYS